MCTNIHIINVPYQHHFPPSHHKLLMITHHLCCQSGSSCTCQTATSQLETAK